MDELTPKPEEHNSIEIGKGSLEGLTDQNWLFISHYLKGMSVKKAYHLAGYQGKSESAPYVLYNALKARITEITNTDIASRSRLLSEVNKLLEIPLDESIKTVDVQDKLRILKFLAAVTPEAQASKSNYSVFVINRTPRSPEATPQQAKDVAPARSTERGEDTKPTQDIPPKTKGDTPSGGHVIDAELIP